VEAQLTVYVFRWSVVERIADGDARKVSGRMRGMRDEGGLVVRGRKRRLK
jgi:hypothetical protein